MKKPSKKKVEHWDYHECQRFVAQELGVKDLRNFADKGWDPKDKEKYDRPYQDFWHFVCDRCEPANGSYINIGTDMILNSNGSEDNEIPEWIRTIVKKFVEEFGADEEYWVWW